jgi:hypothetical protein
MRYLPLLALFAATPALAQQPPPEPAQVALGQTLTETLGQMIEWRARAIGDERRIAELEKQLADAKNPAAPAAAH